MTPASEAQHVMGFLKEVSDDTGKIILDENFREKTREYRMHENDTRRGLIAMIYREAIERPQDAE